MRTRRRLIVAGTLTFMLGLIIVFPARVAYRWFAPDTVAVSGITGSIWSGSADHASSDGIYFHDLSWRFKPLGLFTAKLVYAIAAKPNSGFVEGDIGLGIGGTLHISNLQAAIGLQALDQIPAIRGVRGNASLRFEELTIKDGLPVAANGIVEISNLVIPFVTSGSIGGYRAEFHPQQEGGINASIEDMDGAVDLAGSLALAVDRTYEFRGLVAAKPETPQGVRQQLQFLGSANDRGQHQIDLDGQL